MPNRWVRLLFTTTLLLPAFPLQGQSHQAALTDASPVKEIAMSARLSDTPVLPATSPGAPSKFDPADHRNPPQVPNHDTSGRTCPPHQDCPPALKLRIISIIPNSFPFATDLEQFGNAIVTSSWMVQFTAAYDIPLPASARIIKVDDMPDLNQGKKEVSDYRDYIFKKARAAGIEKAEHHQTIYVLYIPCDDKHQPRPGMDSFGCSSHHPGIDPTAEQKDKLFGPTDSMAVMLGFNPRTQPSTITLDSATVAASHELAEAATDTKGLLQFKLHTDDPEHPYIDSGSNAGGSPWVRESGTVELADMSEGARESEPRQGSTGMFTYPRIYSNKASKAGGDPAVPPASFPYYNVSTDQDWVSVTAGQSVEIPVTAWSTQSIDSWDVNARVARWMGHTATPPAAAPCSLSTRHWDAHNNFKFNVRVQTTQPQPAGAWCILNLKSSKSVPLGDEFHEWFVGVIIKPPIPQDDSCVCGDGFKGGTAAKAGTPACEHICRGHDRH
jgi:hypothetical protein